MSSTIPHEADLFNEAVIEHKLEKRRHESRRYQSERKRKLKVGCGEVQRRHWPNRTGKYRNPEQMKVPKYYRTKPYIRPHLSIRNWPELRTAIQNIHDGARNQDHYKGVDGTTRQRLILAQSLRDRGVPYEVSYIAHLSPDHIDQIRATTETRILVRRGGRPY
ncbi:MAG: hypothetical protein JSV63_01685 [Candidatus Aenigmatarchaeota archaeon]|nr:MAG: hypothetical protein JSV63_01685 [Candidatus Aenigmarchaeota archaeon]